MKDVSIKSEYRFWATLLAVSVLFASTYIFFLMKVIYPFHINQMKQRASETVSHLKVVAPHLHHRQKQFYLVKIAEQVKDLSYLLILDLKGNAIAHSNPSRVGMNFDEPGLQRCLETSSRVEQIYIRDPDNPESPYHGEKTLDIFEPFMSASGELIGAVNVGLSMAAIETARDKYIAIAIAGVVIWIIFISSFAFYHLKLSLAKQEVSSALRESRIKYKQLVENTSDIPYSLDTEGTIAFIGPQISRYGNEPSQVERKNFIEFVDVADREEQQRLFDTSVSKGQAFDSSFRMADAGKGVIWFEAKGNPIKNDAGDFIGFTGILRDITDRRKTEEELEDTRALLMAAIDQSPAGVIIADAPDARIRHCNPAGFAIRGETDSQLVDITIEDHSQNWQVYHPDGRLCDPEELPLSQSIIYGKTVSNQELIMRRANGENRYVLGNSAPVTGASGRVIAGIVIFTDITEQKLAEIALRQNEENLRITLQSIGDAVISTDINGDIVRMNPAAEELTGWRQEEAEGKPLPEVFHIVNALNRAPVMNPVTKVLMSGDIVGLANHTILIARDGMERQIADSGAPIRDAEGNIQGVVLVFRDVTEEYALQEKVKESEKQFRGIFETSPYAISIKLLSDSTYLAVNPQFEQMTGFSASEVIGKNEAELGLNTLENMENNRDFLKRGGVINNSSYGIRTSSGEERELLASATLIEFQGRQAILTVSIDVTETKRLEEQLRQAQKMDVLGQLAGGIAHDFNNMLGGIMGNAELLAIMIPEDSPLRKHVNTIIKGSERAADLTGKLLAFSRKGKVVSTVIDVHDTIRSAISLLERSIDRKISIKMDFNSENPNITGDPALLQNVFLNLAVNARDAMTDGGVITFATSNIILDEEYCNNNPYTIEPGPYVEIDVKDTGMGMTNEVRQRLFEPFFTTKPEGKGTGLGLAAVYGTVKEHRGAINVYSEPGKGSIFKIYLPVDSSSAPKARPLPEEPVVKGRGSILVVDDESIIRNTAHAVLTSLGYDVLLAQDGMEALEIYKNEGKRITVVLLDLVMPKISGQETFRRLKAIDPAVKVLFSSGFSQEGNVSELLKEGAAGFIQKPYRRVSLNKAIQEAIELEIAPDPKQEP